MKRLSWLYSGVLFCLFFSSQVRLLAQENAAEINTDDDRWALTLYTANDSSYYVPGSTADRYFTHGTKLTLTHHPQWAAAMAQKLGSVLPLGKQEPVDTAVGYVFGQNIYTPNHIDRLTINPNDRPYAGWLYGGMYFQRSVGDREFDHLELDMGVVGPSSLAEQTQKIVHDLLASKRPEGWDSQLHDEFGINFIYQHKWKFTVFGDNDGDMTLQAIPQAGFTVGNLNRNVNADITMRLGWNIPSDFGPGRIDDVVSATTNPWTKNVSFYGFVRTGGRYVEHDLFISGNNDHNSQGVAEANWVGEVQYGVALSWKRLIVTWSNRHITHEYDNQPTNHIIGTWMLSYSQPF
jgi:hypothetical protein